MKFRLTYRPNPDCLIINVNIKLTNKSIEVFESSKDVSGKHKKFTKELFKIDGISGVSLQKYELHLEKGSIFEWKDLTQKAIMVILIHYCPNEKAIEIAKPEKEIIDMNGFSRLTTMEEQETHTYSLPNINELIK